MQAQTNGPGVCGQVPPKTAERQELSGGNHAGGEDVGDCTGTQPACGPGGGVRN